MTVGFRSIALAAALISPVLSWPAAARAGSVSCGELPPHGEWCGYHVMTTDYGDVFKIDYRNGDESEKLTIVCDGRYVVDWESRGNLEQGQADWVATEFCALPSD